MWMFPVPIDQLKPEPPAKIKGQERPWSERDGALELIRDFTKEALLTCRQYAKRFNWGSNGHRYVADLIERLGFKIGSTRGQKQLVLHDLDGRYSRSKPKNTQGFTDFLPTDLPTKKPSVLPTKGTDKPSKNKEKQESTNINSIHSNTHKNTQGFTDFLPTSPGIPLSKENKKKSYKTRVTSTNDDVNRKKPIPANFYPAAITLDNLAADYPEIGRPIFEAYVPIFRDEAAGREYTCWHRAFGNWCRRGIRLEWGFWHPNNLKRLKTEAVAECARPRPAVPQRQEEAREKYDEILSLAEPNAKHRIDMEVLREGVPIAWDGETLSVQFRSNREAPARALLHVQPLAAWPFAVNIVSTGGYNG